ncbi:DUF418 domain-containing protein [Phenylobacterium sp.]|jgi:uncharacterized protein|uniref:DUF418 domain-containing protein n=1 Tax=Phenylobacterium sp. TaxID=1871053 RepID=UPI002F959623
MSGIGNAPAGERHLSIDAVRGFAVLGILLMNIVAMGLPSFAYLQPTFAGGSEGADLWTWAVNNVLVDGKMRALFTFLFGASAVLIADRAASARGLSPAQTHYRRMFWLAVFGLLHAVFFWFGDILVTYAVAGLVIFPFRKLSPRAQVTLGAAILLALLAKNLWQAEQLATLRAAASAPGAPAALVAAWQEARGAIAPPPQVAAAELAGFGGGFVDAVHARLELLKMFYTYFLPQDAIPEAIGQMFIGMALFRLGFFTLRWTSRAYAALAAFGYLVCAPVTAWLAWLIWRSGFEPLVLHELEVWQQTTRPFIALAHAAALLLLVRSGATGPLVDRLAAAGRMAFSNYLMTSIITAALFGGWGFGLFGELSRAQLLFVVAGVWAFILLWSRPWLARFRYGPFEWAWRSLVQWRRQALLRAEPGPAGALAE